MTLETKPRIRPQLCYEELVLFRDEEEFLEKNGY